MSRKLEFVGAAALIIAGTALAARDGPHPTDAEIAHIAYTAGAIDVAAGKQALALVKKLGVTPQDNATSAALSAAAAAEAKKLDALSGAAFDRA